MVNARPRPLPWTSRARRLRQAATDCEALLWSRLRNRRLAGYKVRRQCPIDRYVVDFVCSERRLVIEVDGGQHAVRSDADAERTRRLQACGFRVLRFWNNEVIENLDGVLQTILAALDESSARDDASFPHPDPLLKGEGDAGAVGDGLRVGEAGR